MKIKVLMVDDHALFRDGMRYVLQQLADEVEVIDSGNFVDGMKQAAGNPDLDLALLDLNMPGSDGVKSIQAFHEKNPCIPLVVVSGSDQRDDIEKVMECGAMGFISKMSSSKMMLSALRMVLDGGVYLPPQLLQQAMVGLDQGGVTDKRTDRQNKNGLTVRQMQTLQLLAEGLSNKEISQRMNLAEGTVKIHTAAVYQALRVSSRLEAVCAARLLGFLPPPESDADGTAVHR
ncbi:MAG: response regulator transcription factor [Gallionellaceae bacterium]|nr:MAG: response regulator transcription factor [Gallionellaceae bacterium]